MKERNAVKYIGIFVFDRVITNMMAEIAKITVKLWIKNLGKFSSCFPICICHGWFGYENSLTCEL